MRKVAGDAARGPLRLACSELAAGYPFEIAHPVQCS